MGIDVELKLKPFPDYDDQESALCLKLTKIREESYIRVAEKYFNGDVPVMFSQIDVWNIAAFNGDDAAGRKVDELWEDIKNVPGYKEADEAIEALIKRADPDVPFCTDLRDITGSCWRWNKPLKDLTNTEFLPYIEEHSGYKSPIVWKEVQFQCDLWIGAVEKYDGDWGWDLNKESLLKGLQLLRTWTNYALDNPEKVFRISVW